ncbi:hypothetical protein [Candidatus Enterococcus courvalinii]|uniref:Integral membrane protein n=1 Tax=Candidatus Enterococcus courvalinii TaxID=2815329 RepID=A0ABS3I086_9ENTE|nr:hypothetical protein [Enterococcus sp. MSG2901]MBO0481725.1 hypothetical protein [Enterococcus sp. MSG2901]
MLKKYLSNIFLLLFLIPYMYLGLLLDFHYHSVSGFIFLIFLAILGGFLMRIKGQIRLLLVGNIISTIVSYIYSLKFPDWQLFYQPFKPTQLILVFAFLYLVPQAFGAFWATFFTYSKQTRNQKIPLPAIRKNSQK